MPIDFLVPPWEHQRIAIERARECSYFGLFFEPGTGKTSTMINILRQKYIDEKKPLRTLILCPPIVIENWKREFATYSWIPQEKIVLVNGTGWHKLCQTDNPFDGIYITNYQSLLNEKLFERFQAMQFKAIVLDESHKIKTYNSKTTKAVQRLGALATYRYVLSGSPLLNQATDVFPQIFFMDRGETFGKSFFEFRQAYYHDFNAHMPRQTYFPNWKMKPSAVDDIHNKIEPISMRIKKEKCLDLPPLVRQRVDCEMTPEQSRIYKELEKDFVAELKNGYVLTDMELTKHLRLQQIVSGFVPNERGENHVFRPNGRIGALRDLLESLVTHHKVVVWGVFRQNFEDIGMCLRDLGIPFVQVHGGVSGKHDEAIQRFQKDDTCRVFIGHPRAAGIGINLTAASYSIFYSRSFSLEDDLQAEARNYRGGSERHDSITRIDLVTPGTIDEVILTALANKQLLGEAILRHYEGKLKCQTYQQPQRALGAPRGLPPKI